MATFAQHLLDYPPALEQVLLIGSNRRLFPEHFQDSALEFDPPNCARRDEFEYELRGLSGVEPFVRPYPGQFSWKGHVASGDKTGWGFPVTSHSGEFTIQSETGNVRGWLGSPYGGFFDCPVKLNISDPPKSTYRGYRLNLRSRFEAEITTGKGHRFYDHGTVAFQGYVLDVDEAKGTPAFGEPRRLYELWAAFRSEVFPFAPMVMPAIHPARLHLEGDDLPDRLKEPLRPSQLST